LNEAELQTSKVERKTPKVEQLKLKKISGIIKIVPILPNLTRGNNSVFSSPNACGGLLGPEL
jgi:hypothetical protein